MQSYPEAQYPTDSHLPAERPRDVFEIVSEAFNLYGKGFVNLWLPFLIIAVIVGFLSAMLTVAIGDVASETDWENSDEAAGAIGGIIFLSLGTIVIGMAGDAIATGMVVYTVKDLAENKPPPPLDQVFKKTQPKIVPLIIGGIIFALILIGAIIGPILVAVLLTLVTGTIIWIFIALAGIFVLVPLCVTWFYVWAVCIILEDQPVTDSFRRSKKLVQGDGWHALGLVIVSGLVVMFLGGILSTFTSFFIPVSNNIFIGTIAQNAASSIVSPLAGIMTILLYFDLKARKEMAPAPWERARTVAQAPYPSTAIPPGVAAVFCSECGTTVAPETSFCPNCGSKIQVAPPKPAPAPTPTAGFCPECGTSLPRDMVVGFCPNCGAKVH
jgi:hypothetical protein